MLPSPPRAWAAALVLALPFALAPDRTAAQAATAVPVDDTAPGQAASSAASRWGGVAQWRSIELRPGAQPSARVHEAVLRLTYEHAFEAGPSLTAHAQWQRLHASSASIQQQLRQAASVADRALRLTSQQVDGSGEQTFGFDWLYLQGNWKHGRYAVGRQPINLAIGRLWSPTDLFAPFLPNDLERLYKPGVDAAQLAFFASEGLELTLIASGERRDGASTRLNWQQRVDLQAPWGKAFALVGRRDAQQLLGMGGQVNNLGGNDVYAELLWHRGPLALPGSVGARGGTRALIGASRKLAADTVGNLEFFHQSRGTANPMEYDAFTQRAAGIDLPSIGVGRYYAGASVTAQPHPLVGLNLLLLANLDDHSTAATAAIEYTPLPDLKLRATLTAPLGGRGASEYRRAGQSVQLGLQWFF